MLLVLQAVVSFRSVPRILELFRSHALFGIGWVPHFTSGINWTLRVGLGLLKQVAPIDAPWVAIIDHSIDIGTKKVLVVLRVPLAALSQRGAAIQLEDCQCIGLTIAETVNGETVARHLGVIFQRSGAPAAIIKDCDFTLQKGVRLWMEHAHLLVPVIEDIGHVMAAALKAQFEQTRDYQRFTTLAAKAAKALRQTELAFLIPPKLRSKGRFLSLGKLARWGEKMLGVLAVKGRAKKGSPLAKLRAALPGFLALRAFVETFAATAVTVSQVMERLKNNGLDRRTYAQCSQLAQRLPASSAVRQRLEAWLSRHLEIHSRLTSLPLVVSSDIVESLFGNFKHILERSPQTDMNRTVLLIPALCGNPDAATILKALDQARHGDLVAWEQENIPYTMRKKRQAFFADNQAKKQEISSSDSRGISTA
ncbi:hypothetical protein [Thiocystis violacea]|uniref:hypothetical protein n=1 Tax=Thiocystis violacea TaxID=13725 RepID=UPI001903B196|nr:hypothetical protein [Thiocystis violacea]